MPQIDHRPPIRSLWHPSSDDLYDLQRPAPEQQQHQQHQPLPYLLCEDDPFPLLHHPQLPPPRNDEHPSRRPLSHTLPIQPLLSGYILPLQLHISSDDHRSGLRTPAHHTSYGRLLYHISGSTYRSLYPDFRTFCKTHQFSPILCIASSILHSLSVPSNTLLLSYHKMAEEMHLYMTGRLPSFSQVLQLDPDTPPSTHPGPRLHPHPKVLRLDPDTQTSHNQVPRLDPHPDPRTAPHQIYHIPTRMIYRSLRIYHTTSYYTSRSVLHSKPHSVTTITITMTSYFITPYSLFNSTSLRYFSPYSLLYIQFFILHTPLHHYIKYHLCKGGAKL